MEQKKIFSIKQYNIWSIKFQLILAYYKLIKRPLRERMSSSAKELCLTNRLPFKLFRNERIWTFLSQNNYQLIHHVLRIDAAHLYLCFHRKQQGFVDYMVDSSFKKNLDLLDHPYNFHATDSGLQDYRVAKCLSGISKGFPISPIYQLQE